MAADNTTRIVLSAVDNTSGVLQKVQLGLGNVGFAANSLRNVLSGVTSALAVRELIQAADGYASLNARLKLATNSASEFATAQAAVFNIAQRSGSDLVSVGDLYASLSRSTQQLGVSQSALLGVVESINQALVISGGSSESAAAALVQLGQGFSAGALRGEELNSVMEQAPRLAKAIADGLGVPIGKLREMGQAGELTAERVFSALQKSSGALQKEFEQMPITVSRATTEAGNSLLRLIGVIDQATGATGALALAISGVSRGVDNYIDRLTGQGIQKAQADVDDLRQRLVIMMQTKSEDHPMVKLLQNQLDKAVQTLQTLKREMSGDQTAAETARLRRMGSSRDSGPSLSSVAGIQEQIKKLTALRNAADINSDTFKRLSAEIKQYQDRLDKAVPSSSSQRSGDAAARRAETDALRKVIELAEHRNRLFDEEFDKQEAQRLTVEGRIRDAREMLEAIQAETRIMGLSGVEREKAVALLELERKGVVKGTEAYERLAPAILKAIEARSGRAAELMTIDEVIEESAASVKKVGRQASTTMAESIADGILNGARDGVSIMDIFWREVKAQAARTILQPIIQPVAQGFSDIISGGLGALTNALGMGVTSSGYNPGASMGFSTDWEQFMPSFAGGGYTGTGARAGGMDGRGGFLAMLHPNETVVDHTRGQSAGGSVTVQIINNGQPMAVTRQQESTGADGGRLIQITAEALANDVDNGSGPLTRAIERRFGLRTSMA